MKIIKIGIVCFLFLIINASTCKKNSTSASGGNGGTTVNFIKGADISWVTQMESAGIRFYNRVGADRDCFILMKELGMNAIRLRVWVNPASGWNNIADLVAKAVRAKAAGLMLMIDFHYSDSWADPGQQNKPAAWASQNISQLRSSLYDHTVTVLNALKSAGVTPAWVQVGNETNDGMLWPEGRASANMQQFASLIQSGYNAVKSVDSTIRVIVHISNGYDNNLFRWIFDGLKTNQVSYDIIGMSLYPSSANWQTLNQQCLANMIDMNGRYGKPVMICETGMPYTDSVACKAFITDLMDKVKTVPANNGLGVLYWEPQSYNNWQGYTLGAFNNSGKPTIALGPFQ